GINLRDIRGVYEFVEKEIMDNLEDDGLCDIEHIDSIEYQIHNMGYENQILIEQGNFTVKRGDIVMLQGESGCGKTTMMKGLVKFFDIENIKINNRDINEYKNSDIRKKITFFS